MAHDFIRYSIEYDYTSSFMQQLQEIKLEITYGAGINISWFHDKHNWNSIEYKYVAL